MNQSDLKDIVDNVERFIERCTVLMAQQQVCISHACSSLGLQSLSGQWLSEASDSIGETEVLEVKDEARAVSHILSLIKRDAEVIKERPCLVDRLSLYEGGMLVLTDRCNDKQRLFIHIAFAALQKGLSASAMETFHRTVETYDSPTPPGYCDELLHAIDAQIIIRVEEGGMNEAVQEMQRRLDVVSKWTGNTSFELANDLHRLGCFHSILGNHAQCAKHLEESLDVGAGHDDYDTLGSFKLLATTYDATNDTLNAIRLYQCALSMEEDSTAKARLMNAISHLHLKVGGRSQLAIDYLNKSIAVQKDEANKESGDANLLLFDTMILYGNAMAAENSFSQAIDWYESALSSNPDKSAIHPSNLRAWYNKGVALFRSGDPPGAMRVFGIIIDEVDKNSKTAPRGTASVLNAIGSIYYGDKHFAGAIERFRESLSLKKECENEILSPRQLAGSLCNIASAHYRIQEYKDSEKYFNEALVVAESLDESSSSLKATIMCKLAYLFYRRRHYLRAHSLFSYGKVLPCRVVNILVLYIILALIHSPQLHCKVMTSLMLSLVTNVKAML
jgi:tetratricopeptide (TPR) repeat protein